MVGGFVLQQAADDARAGNQHAASSAYPRPLTGGSAPAVIPHVTEPPQHARFKIVHKASGGGEEYASVHQTGCKVDSGEVLWIDAHAAWVALSDGVPGCGFCRPGLELGFDAD